jgi:tRNA (cytidine/uridine-2'-O-)-methyltransferase
MPTLTPHNLSLALLQPQIAPNTGNIARLCVATGTALHLVRPLGFVLSDQKLRRSAMDYWPRLQLTVHGDTESFLRTLGASRAWFFTSKADASFWEAEYRDGETLVFGNETHGLSDAVLEGFPERLLRIPQSVGERCLNLSTAAGIALYEALRQVKGH